MTLTVFFVVAFVTLVPKPVAGTVLCFPWDVCEHNVCVFQCTWDR